MSNTDKKFNKQENPHSKKKTDGTNKMGHRVKNK